jgi:hypothetical protein
MFNRDIEIRDTIIWHKLQCHKTLDFVPCMIGGDCAILRKALGEVV